MAFVAMLFSVYSIAHDKLGGEMKTKSIKWRYAKEFYPLNKLKYTNIVIFKENKFVCTLKLEDENVAKFIVDACNTKEQ